jgi:adenylate kinase family enzyme
MDDRPEVVLNRLQVYENAIEPVLEHYKINNKLRIFEGNDSPSIYKKIQAALTVDAGTNK